MGLELIALGFVLLECFHITKEAALIFIPTYISMGILLMGLLSLKKKKKSKGINLALILGLLIVIIPFAFYLLSYKQDIMLLEIVFYWLHFLFVCILFSILASIDKQSKRFMLAFVIALLVMNLSITVSLLFDDSNVMARYDIFFMILSFVRFVLCLMIAYSWYKQNLQFIEEQEDIQPQSVKRLPRFLLILGVLMSLTAIMLVGTPLTQYLTEIHFQQTNNEKSLYWYGQIDHEIIVEGMAYEKWTASNEEEGQVFQDPYIWINDKVFQQSQYAKIDLFINQNLKNSTQVEIFEKDDPQIPSRKGFQMIPNRIKNQPMSISYAYDASSLPFDPYLLEDYQNDIAVHVTMLDKNKKQVAFYQVPLQEKTETLRTFSYQDEELNVSQLKIDEDFIVCVPHIKYSQEANFILSDSKELSSHQIELDFSYGSNQKNVFSSYHPYQTYLYFPRADVYYLHIVKYENNQMHIIKTVRLNEE